MSRPDYSALGATVSLTDLALSGNGGNPDLKPVRAGVYDAALEWYYAPTSLATVSVFYDDLSSYVTYGVHQATYLDQLLTGPAGPPVYKTYSISSPVNTSGELKGIELQIQQPLPMGFGFQANYTYVDGADASGSPLVGTSRTPSTSVGYFENSWLSARLAYTLPFALLRRSRPLVGRTGSRQRLSSTASVNFSGHQEHHLSRSMR